MHMITDFTTATPGKEHSRYGTLDLVREQSRHIWSRRNQSLRLDWVELSGTLAPSFRVLLDAQAIQPGMGRFIGVDTEDHVIQGCQEHYAAEIEAGMAEWRHGNLITLLRDRGPFQRAGVLVYDSFDGAHGRKALSNIRTLLEFAAEQAARLHEFLLVINVVSQRTRDFTDYQSLIREYAPGADLSLDGGALVTYEGRGRMEMLLARIRFGF